MQFHAPSTNFNFQSVESVFMRKSLILTDIIISHGNLMLFINLTLSDSNKNDSNIVIFDP